MSKPEHTKARSFARQRQLFDKKLQELQEQKFYGRVTLDVCAGNILQARIEKSWKLKEEADGIPVQETCKDGRQDQEAATPT